jgi:hypothetical protein
LKTGRYSRLKGDLAEKIALHQADTDPSDLVPELSILRALMERMMVKFEGTEEVAIPAVSTLIDGIRKTVDTINKMQTRELLTSRELEAGITIIASIIAEEVTDPAVSQRIAARFRAAFRLRGEVIGTLAGAVK